MKYQLVYVENDEKQVKEFESVWDALKLAIAMLETEGRVPIGIANGGLMKEFNYVLRRASIVSIQLLLGNCPGKYWME